jgi:3',5'-cyclic AMP phosphodiesterase CpdA
MGFYAKTDYRQCCNHRQSPELVNMRLVHLTDPHLSSLAGQPLSQLSGKRWSGYLSWRKNRSRRYLPAVLEILCRAVSAEQAEQILVTGDLVQIGLDHEIRQASDWLRELGPPGRVMLVPGNHDIYAGGSAAAVQSAWSDYLQGGEAAATSQDRGGFPVRRDHGHVSLVGVSSACVTPVFMATGKLGASQLGRLREMLEQAARERQLVCLLIHHPPLPGMTNWRKALSDAKDLEEVLKTYPPAIILHGHLHHNRELQWGHSRIYCTSAASSASDASYRIFDITENDENWKLRMTLKSISMDDGQQPSFIEVDSACWEVPKNLS